MTRSVSERNSNYNRYYQVNNQTSPIIDGYFPAAHKTYKEMAIARVNKSLCALLILFILASAISYYFVTSNEMTLNKYRKQVLALNDENVELQNKLDYLKSYYNVDKAMQKQHLLQKAKNVIEVKGSPATAPVDKTAMASSSKTALWSLGF